MSEPGGDVNGGWPLAPIFWMCCEEKKKMKADSKYARNE